MPVLGHLLTLVFRGNAAPQNFAGRDLNFKINPGFQQFAFVLVTILWLSGAMLATAETYLELPIVGQIGTDVTPEYVRDVLQHAVDHGVEHVVIRIDTGGGFVPPAEKISKTLREFDDRLTYHAAIQKCVSAGIWMAFACDTVHMAPDAIWGAAAVHDTLADNTTRYNDKSSAIYAAEIAAYAQRHSYSPVLVRGMVVTGAEVWSWTDAQGQRQLTAYRPDPGVHTDLVQLDGNATLLTLTGPEAQRAGIAPPFDGDAASLGAALGFDRWRALDGYGTARSVHARFRRNLEEFKEFNDNLRRDPNLLSWKDFRYDGVVPSLFGQPQPGLDPDTADQALAEFIERLDTAYQEALAAEPTFGSGDTTPKDFDERCHAARDGWARVERVVAEVEDRYRALTGMEAQLNSLKSWPLPELERAWDQSQPAS